ncbi:hypothetical protein Salat_2632600 [Sesamum alatum]|uniref:Zinc knuckle CX2CX4HX4C domain-containing protein n=1 Tax=Sesamum alatum TaxID=300844 RepID=A0AAE1XNQ8_9LAMI|nr:hypothetical protein Salat_2632600 [Sesamum alatum]
MFYSSALSTSTALCASIQSMIILVREMEFKQLSEGRILLRFFHVLDSRRALEECPWSFEKNILILNGLGPEDNPRTVDLNWCDFHVHIHDLALPRMNLGVATHIGNKLGIFWDMEMDEAGQAWGAILHIHATINVNHPLKRALKIRTTIRDEKLVHFTYERLSNFCYICGRLGPISKYCELRFDKGFTDLGDDTPYGPWLQAPMPVKGRP